MNTITINIPITKIVQKTGTANLKSTTFTFDIEEIAMEDMPAFYAEDEDDFDINDYVVKKSITISAEEGEVPQFFPEAIQKAARELDSSTVDSYLLDLAKDFSTFYRNCPVLNAEDPSLKAARLQLSARVRDILRAGLSALTINTLESM
jgi:hypothetical protein